MTYPGLSVCNGSSKIHNFRDFWHSFCWRLWRPWMLLSTISKGHKSNLCISWMYRSCFYELEVHFWWPNKCLKYIISSLNTLYCVFEVVIKNRFKYIIFEQKIDIVLGSLLKRYEGKCRVVKFVVWMFVLKLQSWVESNATYNSISKKRNARLRECVKNLALVTKYQLTKNLQTSFSSITTADWQVVNFVKVEDGRLQVYVRNLPQKAKRCIALSSSYPLLAIPSIDQSPPCAKIYQARQGQTSWLQEQARLCHLPNCYAQGRSQTPCPQGCPYVQTQDFRWC